MRTGFASLVAAAFAATTLYAQTPPAPRPVAGQTPGAAGAAPQAPQAPPTSQTPTFRSGIDVTAVDVTVVDNNGQQITNLQAADFNVRIDGRARRVERVEWIPLIRPLTSAPPPPLPEGYSSNEGTTGGRLILIAIDQPNIRTDGTLGLRGMINAFIDRLDPADRIAVVALGHGASTPFTTNKTVAKNAINGLTGEMRLITEMSNYGLTGTEAIDIAEGSQTTLQTVLNRECFVTSRFDMNCRAQIVSDSQTIAQTLRQDADRTIGALYGLFDTLKKIDAPKTLVLVSEGFAMMSSGSVAAMGPMAAEAKTTVFALKLDDRAFDMGSRRPAGPGLGDRQLRYAGLDMMTSSARGGVIDVVGPGGGAFQQLEREISGYYLLGVESLPTDQDGKNHQINVQVRRNGAVVRARREYVNSSPAGRAAPNALESISAALASPLTSPVLPVHVATFSLKDADESKIQVLVHADIGKDYSSAQPITLGYVVSDSKGTVVAHQVGDGRLAPSGSGPSSLGYTFSVSVVPGEYTLKFAAMEGSRIGSVEHPVHAGLIDAATLKISELVIGGPLDAKDLLRPTVSYDVNFGGVQGYMEAYGRAENLLVRYEVAPGVDAPSLRSAVVPGRSSGDDRTVFSYVLPVGDLTPGQYYLRATLSSGETRLKAVARAFRVFAPPAAKAAPAPAPPARTTARPAPTITAAAFQAEQVTSGATLTRFRELAVPAARADFDAGVAALAARDYTKAEVSFKSAQRATTPLGNSTAPLAYLGATYAASGHYLEASNVWQTALIDGSDQPEIYEWLVNALMTIRNFDQARQILREATDKWPSDPRFTTARNQLQQLDNPR
jgi:VWFA-related protein